MRGWSEEMGGQSKEMRWWSDKMRGWCEDQGQSEEMRRS